MVHEANRSWRMEITGRNLFNHANRPCAFIAPIFMKLSFVRHLFCKEILNCI